MNVQITHVIVHSPEQVREIISQATEIADEMYEDGHRWQPTFIQACQLLGQRYTFAAAPQSIPLDPALMARAARH